MDKIKKVTKKIKSVFLSKKKVWIVVIILAIVLAVLLGMAVNVGVLKYKLKCKIESIFTDDCAYSVYYENGVPHYDIDEVDFNNNDVREVQVGKNRTYLINHSRGFALGFPQDAEYDFTTAQEYISVKCENLSCVVSKEYSNYEGAENTKKYVDDYLNKFILNEKYRSQNKITLHKNEVEKIGDFWVQMITLSRTPAPDSEVKYNAYAYCYIYTNSTMFYRLMFKTDKYTDEFLEEIYRTLYSFSTDVPVVGISDTFTDFKPQIPENWNEETREFYDELVNGEECKWGIYTPLAVYQNDFTDIYELEEKLDATFDGVLEYRYYFEDLPTEGLKTAYDEGKVIELTMQTSTVMNENLDGYTPVFDMIDGLYDYRFKLLAQQIKDYGHPILFRLNNEMNTDWTSYSAAACLSDPEIYVELWRRIYDIFKEVGVDNAIWVFNPNDESYPPCGYNTSMAFYPGDEYVQVFGVTGYNTGTYYADLNGEKWKSFDEIYSTIMEKHHHVYDAFPWIITEFASSSVGGDKVQWINDMFRDIKKYPNIKMAFWFNSADYDTRPEANGAVARPYWLDETPETTKAFSDGLKASGK